MMELKVIRVNLDFECCVCNHNLGVTLDCAGKGLTHSTRTVLAFNLVCPDCGGQNRVYFEPCGTVCDVVPYEGMPLRFEPSRN